MAASNAPKVTPFLTFAGNAEEAIKYYVALFENSKVISIEHYGSGEPGEEGSVRIAEFSLSGQRLLAIDSPVKLDWTFTPAVSFYIENSDQTAYQQVQS
jgi:predicted 3-demethylubiquinone-9 3-methyltransferase (glyoxalase superfamily)